MFNEEVQPIRFKALGCQWILGRKVFLKIGQRTSDFWERHVMLAANSSQNMRLNYCSLNKGEITAKFEEEPSEVCGQSPLQTSLRMPIGQVKKIEQIWALVLSMLP